MTGMRRGSVLLALLLALSLLLTACGGKQAQTDPPPSGGTKTGGTLTMGTFADIVTLNTILLGDTSSGDIANLVLANLYDLSAQGSLVVSDGSLAAELPQVSADGKTYTIKLKSTPKWTDGQPVTADDVVFTFQATANPDVGAPSISTFDKLESVKALDPHTVQITLKQVYAPFALNALNAPVMPAHLLKDVPAKELQNHPYGKDVTKTVTNGPFKWTQWQQGQAVIVERDPNYWGKKPSIDKFVYKIYENQQTMVQALIKGDVDVVEGIPVTLLDAVKKKDGLAVLEQPGPAYDYLSFNFDGANFPGGKSPFAGVKTRQAITYAIDRQGMVDSVVKGHGVLLDGPFLANGWAYTQGASVYYNYDANKAKQLLKEDGWTPGPDGILVKDGQKFAFKVQYNAGNARREALCAIIQQNLKDVGIQVDIEPTEWSAFIQNNVNPGKFQAIVLGWQLSIDPDSESIFSGKYVPPNGQNGGWYKNQKLDQLWVDGYSSTDQAKRKAVYAQVAKEMSADPPYVFLLQQNFLMGVSSHVHWAKEDQPVLTLPYGYLFHVQNWTVDNAAGASK